MKSRDSLVFIGVYLRSSAAKEFTRPLRSSAIEGTIPDGTPDAEVLPVAASRHRH
jgi:hypothetical protein